MFPFSASRRAGWTFRATAAREISCSTAPSHGGPSRQCTEAAEDVDPDEEQPAALATSVEVSAGGRNAIVPDTGEKRGTAGDPLMK
jgi:hypothetical protein